MIFLHVKECHDFYYRGLESWGSLTVNTYTRKGHRIVLSACNNLSLVTTFYVIQDNTLRKRNIEALVMIFRADFFNLYLLKPFFVEWYILKTVRIISKPYSARFLTLKHF